MSSASELINLSNNPYEISEQLFTDKEKTIINIKEDCLLYNIRINKIWLGDIAEQDCIQYVDDCNRFDLNKFDDLEYEIESNTNLNSDVTKIISDFIYNPIDIVCINNSNADSKIDINHHIYYLYRVRSNENRSITIYNYRRQNIIIQYKKTCLVPNRSTLEDIMFNVMYYWYNNELVIDRYGRVFMNAHCKYVQLTFNCK